MASACKNHPDAIAHRRCFFCKGHTCPQCTSLFFHHYFCGTKCKTLYLAEFATKKSTEFTRGLYTGAHDKAQIHGPVIFTYKNAGIAAVILFNVIIIIHLFGRTSDLSRELDELNRKIIENSSFLNEPVIQEPTSFPILISDVPDITVNNTIKISGSSGADNVIAVYLNGKLREAKPAINGAFSFDDVGLNPGNNNVIVKALSPDETVTVIDEFSVTYSSPRLEALGRNILRGSRKDPSIALTFDAGSNDNNAEDILNILLTEHISSTIFLTGKFIQLYPELTRRIVKDGHEAGNHTFSHPHLTTFEQNLRHDTAPGITRGFFHNELQRTDSIFFAVTGTKMTKFWRSPYGEQNKDIRIWAAELGYRHIGWTRGRGNGESMDTRDWVSDENSELYMTAEEIRDTLLNFGSGDPDGANGSIILMHLGSTRKSDFPYQTLAEIISGFRNKGYSIITITELLTNTAGK